MICHQLQQLYYRIICAMVYVRKKWTEGQRWLQWRQQQLKTNDCIWYCILGMKYIEHRLNVLSVLQEIHENPSMKCLLFGGVESQMRKTCNTVCNGLYTWGRRQRNEESERLWRRRTEPVRSPENLIRLFDDGATTRPVFWLAITEVADISWNIQ